MAWVYLILAGLEEIISVVAMKYVDGLKHKKPIAVMVIGFMCSFGLLSQAMQVIPIGVAYAVWAGVGTVGIAVVGMIGFKEKINIIQLVFLGMVLIGVVGLQIGA